jgi:hypothetical protein
MKPTTPELLDQAKKWVGCFLRDMEESLFFTFLFFNF